MREIKKNIKEVRRCSLNWSWSDEFFWEFLSSGVVLTGVRTHEVATIVCATVSGHTLTCCTHIFLVYTHCAYISHILVRVTHMHDSRVSAVRMSSSLCHLTFSLLMFHPSLLMLFLDRHFKTFPELDDFTDVSVHAILPNFPDLKSAGQAHSARGPGVWLPGRFHALHGLRAQRVRQDHFCGRWRDAHQRSEPQYLRFLENHEREH